MIPKIDAVKNPFTKADPAKVDATKLAAAQQAQRDARKLAEQNMAARNKQLAADAAKAKLDAKNALTQSLNPLQQKQAAQAEAARLAAEKKLRDGIKATPLTISKDPSKLAANTPATSTKEAGKRLNLATGDNVRLAGIKDGLQNPLAKGAIDDVLRGKQASPAEIAALQAQLNNPNLSAAQKGSIASALQQQADVRRQNGFTNSLNQLNGNLAAGKFPPGGFPPPPPRGGGFGGAFVGGFLGSLIGNLVFPGSGVIIPGGYAPGVPLAGGILFDPNVYYGYVNYGPAVYYPPIQGLDNSGSILVQTIPCGCGVYYGNPGVITGPGVDPGNPGAGNPGTGPGGAPGGVNPGGAGNPDPGGAPLVVIDPTSQDVKLTTRYIRLVNSSNEKAIVSLVLRTPAEDGSFVWLPDEPPDPKQPGKGGGAFTFELLPGEEKDIVSGETPLHGSRARIWATGESGKRWSHFETTDFWLVPETEEDGVTHAYSAPGMETAVYNLR